MANCPCEQNMQAPAAPATRTVGSITYSEPEVRRWPHPVSGMDPDCFANFAGQADAGLHYIQCALSYQNQLLAEIKALLEQLAVEDSETPEEK